VFASTWEENGVGSAAGYELVELFRAQFYPQTTEREEATESRSQRYVSIINMSFLI